MPKIHIRVPGGTPPFTFLVKDGSGNQIASRSSSKREEVFDYAGGAYSYTVTDATGQSSARSVDATTAELLNYYLKGLSITFADPNGFATALTNLAGIQGANTLGISFQVYDWMRTSTQWNSSLWTQRFDHAANRGVNPDQSTFDCPFDKIIYEAKRRGMKLRVGMCALLPWGSLSDQGDFPHAYSSSDLARTVTGARLWDISTPEYYFFQCPSFASDKARTYFAQATAKFCYRYRAAIEDGTITSVNFWFSNSGEAEYEGAIKTFQPTGSGNSNETSSQGSPGDFSEICRTKFAAHCQAKWGTVAAFNAKMGTNINAFNKDQLYGDYLVNGPTLLRKHYQWFLMQVMSDFEVYVMNYAHEQSGIQRQRYWMMDVGSIFDAHTFQRKTLNVNTRLAAFSRWSHVKGNNNPTQGAYGFDQVASAARFAGARGMAEPSPNYPQFTVATQSAAVNLGYQKGLNLSMFQPNEQDVKPENFTWAMVADNVGLGSKPNTFPAPNDLDANGQPITIRIMFKDVCLDGQELQGGSDWRISQAYDAAVAANPNKDINFFIDDSDIRADWANQGGGGGDTGITEIQPLSNVSLSSAPTYSLPTGAMNMTAEAVDFAIQADYAKRGMVNFIHPTRLLSEKGGEYHSVYNPGGITMAQLKTELDAFNLPTSVGIYRMMYGNAVSSFWPIGQAMPNSQQALNEAVEGYAISIRNAVGWQNHPTVLDIDFEDGQFFTWGATKAQADAIAYTLSRNTNIRIQAYASGHNNLSGAGDGSASNPTGHISTAERFRLFKEAGVTVFQGTLPYFHMPSYFWNDPSHEPSVIGDGKMYASQADYALKSIHPIVAKLGWTDGYFNTIPAGHQPANLEWGMGIYEGGDDGGQRYYDSDGNWISGLNWPAVGNWLLESLAVWGIVTGSFRWGGGIFNWSDGRPRKVGQDYLEAGKWRAYQYNRFNNSATQYNIKLEHSLDGGNTWQTDDRPGQNLLQEHTNPKPYVRGAFYNGELLVVAVAGQPFHVNGQSQQVLIRYGGKQFSKTLQSQKVHSFTVNI